jgi:hypothetical protein
MNMPGKGTESGAAGLLTLTATAAIAAFSLATPVAAETNIYHATFIEAYGGPNHSVSTCTAGTSCGTATVRQFGHGSTEVVFDACGPGCQTRVVTFDDGSTLLIIEEGSLADFQSRGAAGTHGYIGFGLPGNPQFLDITQTIISGTGRLSGATGSATGQVKVAGGVAVISVSGTITLP